MPHDPIKKINFYTSTCFEGCDIYDPLGKTYIVSDGTKEYSLIDISTQFKQIAGRIRNSNYKTEIIHIYSTTRYSQDITFEEFEKKKKETMAESVDFADEINGLSEKNRKKILSCIPYFCDKYVSIDNDRLEIDKNLVYLDIRNFKICRQIYSTEVLITKEIQASGYDVTVRPYKRLPNTEKLQGNPDAKISFKDLFEEYHALQQKPTEYSIVSPLQALQLIVDKNPLVKEAYQKLGYEKVIELKYNQTNIRRELLKMSDTPTENKIVQEVDKRLIPYVYIPNFLVKEKLQKIYDDFGLDRKAKATDLQK